MGGVPPVLMWAIERKVMTPTPREAQHSMGHAAMQDEHFIVQVI